MMFNIKYLQNFIFQEINFLNYFKNEILFYFLIENSMLNKNAFDVYFPSCVFLLINMVCLIELGHGGDHIWYSERLVNSAVF
jgi:hypothetical protein